MVFCPACRPLILIVMLIVCADKQDKTTDLLDRLTLLSKLRQLSAKTGPSVYNGFPRMTFFTLAKVSGRRTVVLGFTQPSWQDGTLNAWAGECRREDLERFGSKGLERLRKKAIDALREAMRKESGHATEIAAIMADTIRKFRKDNNPETEGPDLSGFALQLPDFESRPRCAVCLCTTDIRAMAEAGLELEQVINTDVKFKDLEKRISSCAEVETYLLFAQMRNAPSARNVSKP